MSPRFCNSSDSWRVEVEGEGVRGESTAAGHSLTPRSARPSAFFPETRNNRATSCSILSKDIDLSESAGKQSADSGSVFSSELTLSHREHALPVTVKMVRRTYIPSMVQAITVLTVLKMLTNGIRVGQIPRRACAPRQFPPRRAAPLLSFRGPLVFLDSPVRNGVLPSLND
ncbi:hypothetical protein J6590_049055 [Homalodisca vitripennis]|nr:hypothetical protein J6590_049055 [Homalodisca vitripennis]